MRRYPARALRFGSTLRSFAALAALVCLPLAAGCDSGKDAPESAGVAARTSEDAGTGDATSPPTIPASGAGAESAAPKPASSTPEASTTAAAILPGAYDPAKDPLVNRRSTYETASAAAGQIAEDETLYRVLDGNPRNMNAILASSTYEFNVNDALYDGIFTFDAEMRWRLNDVTVESFEESPDHLTYRVKLRSGLVWHDGQPFTAHDVVFSYQSVMDDRVKCPAQRTGTEELADVVAIDDLTVEYRHKQALPTSCWNALFSIIPKHIYEKDKAQNPDLESGEYNNRMNRAPIGNGPYKFVRWVENDKIEMVRWDEYPGPKPHFKRMIFRIVPDPNIMLLSFNKQDVDEFRMTSKQFATQTGPGDDFAKVGYKIRAPQYDLVYICWNMDGSNPFFGDVRVRRAMTHACDIPRMIKQLCYDLVLPSHGIYHRDSWMFNPEIKLIPYDLAAAEKLLDEAGWIQDAERDGWRHKVIDGQPVKFEFTLLIPQASTTGKEMAAIFQEDLKSIGVDMRTTIMEWATFQERIRKHEFQAQTAAWGTGVDPDTTWNVWHSSSYEKSGETGRNYGGYRNARVDELFLQGRHEFDHKKRQAIYREIAKIIYDEQPYVFMWHRDILWAVHKRIRGVTTSPRGVFNFYPSFAAWWVHMDEKKY
ncbi:MAG: ABC transporter substrate-binding protein [Planctomycetes bacterium]|nr:ABC transporter substrate-binding protein [Planctomycetota bacterium]